MLILRSDRPGGHGGRDEGAAGVWQRARRRGQEDVRGVLQGPPQRRREGRRGCKDGRRAAWSSGGRRPAGAPESDDGDDRYQQYVLGVPD